MTWMLLIACASKEVRISRRMEGRYELPDPGEGWERVRSGGADNAWWNEELAASFYTDSNCGVHFEDSILTRLADSQLHGIGEGEPLSEEFFQLDGREAYTRLTLGSVDGVPVELAVTVMKKNHCTYDFVLVAPRGENFSSAWLDAHRSIEGFVTE